MLLVTCLSEQFQENVSVLNGKEIGLLYTYSWVNLSVCALTR